MTPLNSIPIFALGVLLVLLLFNRTPAKFGTNILDPVFCHGGICNIAYRMDLRGSTNTPCSVRSPEATSTLIHSSFTLTTQATSSMLIDLGFGNHNNSTNTVVATTIHPANDKLVLVGTTTYMIPPNQYVNLKTGTPAGWSRGPSGNCEIIFRLL